MKKVKFMLLSLALFAVVGGALAFKAKYNVSYCTTNTIEDAQGNPTCPASPAACPVFINKQLGTPGVRFCTTPTNGNAAAPCNGVLNCTAINTLQDDN